MHVSALHTCTGHRSALYALAPGRTEQHFLSAGGDGWIVEWRLDDPENGRLVASAEQQIFSLAHFPELQLVVAGNMTGGIHWIHTGAPERSRDLQAHHKGVFGLLHHHEFLFSIGGDGVLTRWHLNNHTAVESIHLSAQALRAIAFSPAYNELSVGASDGRIYFLDADTLDIRQIIEQAHQPSVFSLLFTHHGEQLLSGGRDAMLRQWQRKNGIWTPETALPAHLFTINHLVLSPDQRLVASASRDKSIRIWDANTLQLLKVIETIRSGGHVNSVNRLLWTDTALISCSDDRSIKLWKTEYER